MNFRQSIIQSIIAVGIVLLGVASCGTPVKTGNATTNNVPSKGFVRPVPPAVMQSVQDRADYVVSRYWDTYDFADTALLSKPELCEQVFVDFLPTLFTATRSKAEESICAMLNEAMDADSVVFYHFFDLYERYLYHPNSPMRNEELYIPVLQCVVNSDKVGEWDKIRPRDQLNLALKNRPGDIAADFTYTMASGTKRRMSSIKADYTILFVNNPDCEECRRTKEYMTLSPVIGDMIDGGDKRARLAILAVYPDEDLTLWRKAAYPDFIINSYDAGQIISKQQLYDLKAIPTLYLLDKEKKVILKDAIIEQVEAWLANYCKY